MTRLICTACILAAVALCTIAVITDTLITGDWADYDAGDVT